MNGWEETSQSLADSCVDILPRESRAPAKLNRSASGQVTSNARRGSIFSSRASLFVHKGLQQARLRNQETIESKPFSELLQSELSSLQEAFQKSSERLLASSKAREDRIKELERDIRMQQGRFPPMVPPPIARDSLALTSRSIIQQTKGPENSEEKRHSGNGNRYLLAPNLEENSDTLSGASSYSVMPGIVCAPDEPKEPPSLLEVPIEHQQEEDNDDSGDGIVFRSHVSMEHYAPQACSPQPPSDGDGDETETLADHSMAEDCDSPWYFSTLPFWNRQNTKNFHKTGSLQMKAKARPGSIRNKAFKFKELLDDEESGGLDACLHAWTINPGSVPRAWWDMVSIVLVFYDLITIPLQLFDLPESTPLVVMIWVTRIFWTMDLPLSFLTGYIKPDGSLEMRISCISRRYLGTWFGLDIFLVAFDWIEASWAEGFGYFRIGKSSRIFRILRLVRLLRMLRMGSTISMAFERMQSEQVWVLVDILKIVIVVLGLAHIIACVWYGIGSSDSELNWVNAHLTSDMDLGFRYAMSLHWSLSQFTGGMDEMRPHNLWERIYAIMIFVFAFIMAAIFVSNLTSSMTRLHFIASHQSKQFLLLRRYLFQNHISEELMLRIQRNAQHAVLERATFMQEANVELLAVVSEPLRQDLHYELFLPVYQMHPFFSSYTTECPHVMRKVCHQATMMSLVAAGDTVFDAGEIPYCPKMYFLVSGSMQYVSISGQVYPVEAFIWISEATLWTTWMHLGVLTATSECRLVCMEAKRFQDIVGQYEHVGFTPHDYATDFVASLNDADEEITDLPLRAVVLQQLQSESKGSGMSKRMTMNFKKKTKRRR